MSNRMVVEYWIESDPLWSHSGDNNWVGMPDQYCHHEVSEFCCPTMKEKWHREVGFHGIADNIGIDSKNVCLFWSLRYKGKDSPLFFLLDDDDWRKDKIEECPFCHSEIELKRIKHGKKR